MVDNVFTNPIPRDKWGRPGIMQANGKLKYYRRVTKFIKTLEDTYNLEMWAQRMVALGMGMREDLVLAASSLTAGDGDKIALQNVSDDAKEAARSSGKATMGTALHKICERVDKGEQIPDMPAAFVPDVKAYIDMRERTIQQWGLIETMRVYDSWQVAGTPDRTGCIGGKWYIIDLKTGDIEWSEREIAMQLAMYSKSTPYDLDKSGRFEDVPPVDQKKAVVIHLPAGEGRCELHWVDIEDGWDGCLLSKKVWDWRKKRGLFTPFELEGPNAEFPAPTTYVPTMNFAEAATKATNEEELRSLWKASAELTGKPPADFIVACKARLEELRGAVA